MIGKNYYVKNFIMAKGQQGCELINISIQNEISFIGSVLIYRLTRLKVAHSSLIAEKLIFLHWKKFSMTIGDNNIDNLIIFYF